MASLKQHKTTSRFKRRYRREVYRVMREFRQNEMGHSQKMVNDLVRVTLRQRSGHFMKKGIRQCYDMIPAEDKSRT
jgi:hypothetical protein